MLSAERSDLRLDWAIAAISASVGWATLMVVAENAGCDAKSEKTAVAAMASLVARFNI